MYVNDLRTQFGKCGKERQGHWGIERLKIVSTKGWRLLRDMAGDANLDSQRQTVCLIVARRTGSYVTK